MTNKFDTKSNRLNFVSCQATISARVRSINPDEMADPKPLAVMHLPRPLNQALTMRPRHDIRNSLRRHRLLTDGMTQEDLANRVGATRQTILAIEKGNYNPSVGLALRLAGVLGVPVEAIFQLEEGDGDEPQS